MPKYDALVIGAGLFGATAAAKLKEAGRRVLVLERREYVAGNAADEVIAGQRVCRFGAHIFHTNSPEIWAFVNRFAEWLPIAHRKYAKVNGNLFAFPINLMTLYQLWGVQTPDEAKGELERRRMPQPNPTANLEAWCLHTVGAELYELFIKQYTLKMWGRPCTELPHTIVARVPIRLTYDDRYFSDTWEAYPKEGYTSLVETMLEGVDVHTGVDYLGNRAKYDSLADLTIYTGPIDKLFDCQYGALDYRSLEFRWRSETGLGQGALTVNYPGSDDPRLRSEDYRHMWQGPGGVVCDTYPDAFDDPAKDALYPVRDRESMERLKQYEALISGRLLVGGRLGSYKYLNLDQAIGQALAMVRPLCG